MGASLMKPVVELTCGEVAQAVGDLGTHFKVYCPGILANGVDGSLLDSLADDELDDALDDLSISNRLHRRVLVKALKKAKASKDFVSFEYNYSPSTPTSELEAYNKVTTMCLRNNKETAFLAGVHLCLKNGKQLSLDTKIIEDGKIIPNRLHVKGDLSICSNIADGDQNYYKMPVSEEICHRAFDVVEPLTYTGFALRNESGRKVGMVCMIDRCDVRNVDDIDREAFLHHMAMAVEKELKSRKRDQMMKNQTLGSDEDIVNLAFRGGVSRIASLQNQPEIENRESSYKRSASWPVTDKIDIDRTLPLEASGLMDIEAEDKIASHLKNVVAMAAQAFGFPYAEIIFQCNDSHYRVATVSSSNELNDALGQMHQVVKQNQDGTPFLCKMRRASVMYSQSLRSARTLVVQDLARERTFPLLAAVSPIRSFISSPIINVAGKSKAILCLYDTRPRLDIDIAQEFQVEQFARLVMQTIENWAFSLAIEGMEYRRKRIARQLEKSGPPVGDITIVATGIEGYAALSESFPVLMQDCQKLHDMTVRKTCEQHWGYEIKAEQGEFAFAFHDPVDAIGFALDSQQALFDADWPQELLRQPEAKEDAGAFRGLRVRIGIHQGRVNANRDATNSKIDYEKASLNLANSLSSMACGGQILTTFETWDMASYFAGTSFTQPQVLDLGVHVMRRGKSNLDGVDTKHIIQLVPCKLAYDYFVARKLPSEPEEDRHCDVQGPLRGRQFPPLVSLKQVGASFHDAPFQDNKATLAFVNLSAIDDCRVSFVVNLIGFLLDCEQQFNGYQCEKEMLVFRRPLHAVMFGLRLQEELRHQEPQADGTSLAKLIKYGCLHDSFLTMGPHRTTGRADYFGKAVNRAARLTSCAPLGTISFGVTTCTSEKQQEILDLLTHTAIEARFIGKQTFKGIRDEFNVYECSKVSTKHCSS